MITLKLKLRQPSKNKLRKLVQYTDEFTKCVGWYLEQIDRLKTTSRTKIHQACYVEARHLFNLPSANLQVALDKAIEAYRSYLRKEGNKSKPKIRTRFACFRKDTIKLNGNAVRLTLNGERIWLPFTAPGKFEGYLKYPIARSEIREVKGKWYLYLTVKEPESCVKPVSNVLGVDFGLAKIAVVSDVEGKVNIFFRGDKARAKREYFERKSGELKHKKDTRQAKGAWRVLKRLSGKEHRWITDLNHKISRSIVNLAKETNSAIEQVLKSDMDPVEKLKGAVKGHVNVVTKEHVIGALRQQELILPSKWRAQVVAERDRFEKSFQKIIKEGLKAGLFQTRNWKMSTMAALGALNWILRWYSPQGELSTEEIGEAMADFIAQGFGVRQEDRESGGMKGFDPSGLVKESEGMA